MTFSLSFFIFKKQNLARRSGQVAQMREKTAVIKACTTGAR